MKLNLSISARVFLFSAIGLTVGLVVTALLLSKLYSNALTRTADQIAFQQSDALIARLLAEDEASLQTIPSIDARYTEANSGWYWQIIDSNGEVQGVSSSAFGIAIPVLETQFDQNNSKVGNVSDEDGNQLRLFERKLFLSEEESYVITVTASWDEIVEEVGSFQQQAIFVLAVVGILLASLSAVIARVSLGPLLRLSRSVEDVRTGKQPHIDGRFPSEITPVQSEINALLEVNDKILERAKNQVGDLAHGLKTPIAVIRNELDAQDQQVIFQQVDKMQEIVKKYLGRAQLAARSAVRGHVTDPVSSLEKFKSVMNKIYSTKSLTLKIKVSGLLVQCDADDFDEIVGNLIDNAMKWSFSTVNVSLEEFDEHKLQISVDDDGNGLPDDKLTAVLERGLRLDEQVPGTGLGLGIVNELVNVYGGDIKLSHSELGGLRAEVVLPAVKRPSS